MNNFINKILKEVKEMNDDSFFQPKNIENREEKQKREMKEKGKVIFSKIKLGLRNIKKNYKNKKWDSKEEELFLELFSKLHLNEKYKYLLKNENDMNACFFNLKNDTFRVSYNDVWIIFKNKFHW